MRSQNNTILESLGVARFAIVWLEDHLLYSNGSVSSYYFISLRWFFCMNYAYFCFLEALSIHSGDIQLSFIWC